MDKAPEKTLKIFEENSQKSKKTHVWRFLEQVAENFLYFHLFLRSFLWFGVKNLAFFCEKSHESSHSGLQKSLEMATICLKVAEICDIFEGFDVSQRSFNEKTYIFLREARILQGNGRDFAVFWCRSPRTRVWIRTWVFLWKCSIRAWFSQMAREYSLE